VSLREVAREANVNLGLIHRYIGGKQDLLTMVLQRRPGMPEIQTAPPRSPDELARLLLALIAADAPYTRIVLRATLDGFDVPQAQHTFPLIERSVASARTTLPTPDAEVRVGLLAAAALGWQALGPFLLGVLGHDGLDPRRVADALRPALIAFLTAEPAS
jgi:AcrR family transcriptional regulator